MAEQRRVQIRIPDQKQYEGVWDEIHLHLTQGFLTSQSHVLGQTFVFKTVNEHELRLIEAAKPHRTASPEARTSFRSLFIAYSLFMINGENVLVDRPRHMRRLVRTVSRLPGPVQDKILEGLGSLNQRASRLHPMVEVYAYENRSRFRWLQTVDTPVHSVLATGIPGTCDLGMNGCQSIWTALNRLIDRREAMERDWQNAKFVGSCFAGKGVRSVDERDRNRQEKERTEREDLKMKVLYRYLNRLPPGSDGEPEKMAELPDGRQVKVERTFRAESAEELAEQLSAALSGEKDYHDMIVDAQIQRLAGRAQDIEDEHRAIFQRPDQSADGQSMGGGGTRVMGSRRDAESYLKRMEELQRIQLQKARRVDPGESSDGAPDAGPSPSEES